MWAREHGYLGHDQDMALALVHETGPIVRTREILRADTTLPGPMMESLWQDLAVRTRSVRDKWFESDRA